MYISCVPVCRFSAGPILSLCLLLAAPAAAQEQAASQTPPPPSTPGHQHPSQPPAPDHSQHGHDEEQMFGTRDGSGTSWLPEDSPMYGIHRTAGTWQVMWHGNAFVQVLHDGGERGQTQAGSINWAMGMARRSLAGGHFGVRGMASLEPLTIRGCGYPDLLATGEVCEGAAIRDRQHPHDLLMEIAAEFDRPFHAGLRWQIYGGLAGEPALGPVAYPHRVSAMPNPLAPISHHWLDATHITFGVITGGVYNARWKAEASVFNGREPDEHRWDLDLAPLDSVSARISFAPAPALVLQISAGHLAEAEPAQHAKDRIDVGRVTASAMYHRRLSPATLWVTTAAWGRNSEDGETSNAALIESSVIVNDRDTWFGRFEVASKSAHDLDVVETADAFTVAKLQAGFVRYCAAWHGLRPGLGGSVSVGIVPQGLEPTYGNRTNLGIALFAAIRLGAHGM